MFDPLSQYHILLRGTRASGYPNMQYSAPHPFEMSMAAQTRPAMYPFRHQQGQQMQQAGVGYAQGIRPIHSRRPRGNRMASYTHAHHIPGMR